MKHRSCSNLCPKFQAAMDLVARPWTGLVLATLAEAGPLRFSELAERFPTIGDRMLSCRLKELEAEGLVVRRVLAGPPVGVEYDVTEAGRGFREVARAIGRWGERLTADRPAASSAGLPAPRARRASR